MNIGKVIKKLRIERKITQEDLANAIKVSTQAVSKWECGGSPDLELIPLIAKFFGVSTDYLFELPVNDFNNFEQKVADYISSTKTKKRSF